MRRFSGFKSLWATPHEWMKLIPAANSLKNFLMVTSCNSVSVAAVPPLRSLLRFDDELLLIKSNNSPPRTNSSIKNMVDLESCTISKTSYRCTTFLCRPMRIMLRTSFVARRRCFNHRKYFGGMAGTAMYADNAGQNTVDPARRDASGSSPPLEAVERCDCDRLITTPELFLPFEVCFLFSALPPPLPPAFNFNRASIMASNSSSVAANGGWPQISTHRGSGSSRKVFVLGSTYVATKLSRSPRSGEPRSTPPVKLRAREEFCRLREDSSEASSPPLEVCRLDACEAEER
mmetsp:Transcript_28071/g.58516  ORF Transcript_28071/g.58516 Transcript_28071/m.58516 type:complete len:290 (+) Transcript_28071:1052-1921(+)